MYCGCLLFPLLLFRASPSHTELLVGLPRHASFRLVISQGFSALWCWRFSALSSFLSSCPLPHHNLPVYLMMRTFSRQYFSLFFVLHNHCPHYFLTSLFSFLVICKNSTQFLRLNVFMFLRKALTSFDKYNPMGEWVSFKILHCSKFNNHLFWYFCIIQHFVFIYFFKLTWVWVILFPGDIVCKASLCF